MRLRHDIAVHFAAAEAGKLGATVLPQPFGLPESAFGGSDPLKACESWARHAADFFDLCALTVDAETGAVEPVRW